MRLVVGLGNPGSRYARTRHNVGFRLIEAMAGDAQWRDFRGLGCYARRQRLILAQPMTFMNESGLFISAFAGFHKISPGETLVCFDDVALPLGRLRIRTEGSAGGQKGMESIIEALGTTEIPRLRIGIGPQPAGWDSADFVLSPFSAREDQALAEVIDKACEAVQAAAEEGLDKAMNRFNPAP